MVQAETFDLRKESYSDMEKAIKLKPLASKISSKTFRALDLLSSLSFVGNLLNGPVSLRLLKNAWLFPWPVQGSQVSSTDGLVAASF